MCYKPQSLVKEPQPERVIVWEEIERGGRQAGTNCFCRRDLGWLKAIHSSIERGRSLKEDTYHGERHQGRCLQTSGKSPGEFFLRRQCQLVHRIVKNERSFYCSPSVGDAGSNGELTGWGNRICGECWRLNKLRVSYGPDGLRVSLQLVSLLDFRVFVYFTGKLIWEPHE